MVASRSFSSLISGCNIFGNGSCLLVRQFSAYALHKRMKPCREQRMSKQTNSCIHLYGFIPLKQQKHHTYNNKILWTRKNTFSCARQGLKHLRLYSPKVHCSGCTEQQRMMTAGKSETSHCLLTYWQGWLLRTERPKASTDRSRFQSVRRSIPKNSYRHNGTWAGSASAACWTKWQGWNL